jgi:hypothetical protein
LATPPFSRARQSFLQGLLGPLCTIDLEFANSPNVRAPVTVKGESGKQETMPLYTSHDTVRGQARSRGSGAVGARGGAAVPVCRTVRCGGTPLHPCRAALNARAAACAHTRQVHLSPAAGKKIDHQGIKVELLGTIELFFDRGNTYDFVATCARATRQERARDCRRGKPFARSRRCALSR